MNRPEWPASFQPTWPQPNPNRMARDFMFWRHLRVVRARMMRKFHSFLVERAASKPVRTVYGVKMWPNWEDKTYAYCHYGTYGNYLADLLKSMSEPFCFLDIGANQGLFSLIAGQNPACTRIIALEPVGQTHGRLVANIAANDLEARAEGLNFGLSDQSGEFPITLSAGHSGMATLSEHGKELPGFHPKTTVRLETMARLSQHLPQELPIFVKIDVEGHEETVMRQLLASPDAARIMAIFYEHDDRWTDKQAVNALLDEAGFELSRKYGRGKHYDVLATPRTK